MGTSGNPAKRAAEEAEKNEVQISSAGSFKKKKGQVLKLPSGEVVRAHKVALQSLVLKGHVPNALMTIVSEALEKGQKADIAQMVGLDEGKIDLDMVQEMYDVTNTLVVASIVEPKVHPEPAEDEERDDELLYVDEIDDEDKMFIFQWCTGGTDDVATFRKEASASMASLAKLEGAGATPE